MFASQFDDVGRGSSSPGPVGILCFSVDGPRAMHDAFRVTKGGEGSFDDMIRGWKCLRRRKVDANILCTIHSGDENHPLKAYRFFRDELKAQYIQLIPIVERAAPETIVLVEQILAATLTLARRVYIVNNGHVVLEGPAGELNGRPQILERFLGV